MPTHGGDEAGVEIPVLRKKDKDDERKAGAIPWFSGSAGRAPGGFAGRALGPLWRLLGLGGPGGAAAGARGVLPLLVNFLASDLGIFALAGLVVGSAVYGVYSLNMAAVRRPRHSHRAGGFFARPSADSDERAAPGAGGDSLRFFSSANKGILDPPPADVSAQASGEAPAAASAPDGAALPDAAASAEAAAARDAAKAVAGSGPDSGGAAAPQTAQLRTSHLGSGAAGGSAGLSAGNGLAGGSGLAAGVAMKFHGGVLEAKADPSALSALRAAARPDVNRIKSSPVRARGKAAMTQLRFANAASQTAVKTGAAEGQSYHAAEAFGGAPAAAGGATVGGAGAGGGAGNGGAGAQNAAPSEGPVADGNLGRSAAETPPSSAPPQDVSPWTPMLMMSQAMLMMASLIIMIIGILSLADKYIPALTGIKLTLFSIAAGLAAAVTVMGLMIATTYGQTMQGAIIATGGAITTAAAVAALAMPGKVPAWVAVLAGVAGLAASVWGLLGGAGAPSAAPVRSSGAAPGSASWASALKPAAGSAGPQPPPVQSPSK